MSYRINIRGFDNRVTSIASSIKPLIIGKNKQDIGLRRTTTNPLSSRTMPFYKCRQETPEHHNKGTKSP
jgi:hypothetical protein